MKNGDAPPIEDSTVRMVSSCLTEQVSYDVKVENKLATGIFTRAMNDILRANPKSLTFMDFLKNVTKETEKYKQTPQMSFGRKSDINSYFTL